MEVPLLKGKLKFKEGRSKWKNRFIVFYRPVSFGYHLQLYVLKSEDDFGKLRLNTNGYINQESLASNSQSLVQPYDQIFGLECGHRIDKNAHSIMLLGRTNVCFVGHPDFLHMIEWSDRLQRELNDVYYHATLCEVSPLANDCNDDANGRASKTLVASSCSSASSSISSSTSSTAAGAVTSLMQAGTLHIAKSRVCFVSEPASGSCKLIGSWDMRSVRHFGTTPNESFCLEVDEEEKKGAMMYTFKSQRVQEIYRDVQAVFSDRLPPSILMHSGTMLSTCRTKRQSSSSSSSGPTRASSAAMQIPPSGTRRSIRRRRRSRDHTLPGVEGTRGLDSAIQSIDLQDDELKAQTGPLRRSSVNTAALGGGSCSSQPRRRHSNCGTGGGSSSSCTRFSNGIAHQDELRHGITTSDTTCHSEESTKSQQHSTKEQQHRRLHGEDETSAYTVFVPPARMSPTVVRRRDTEHSHGAGGEPQRSVSFRLSSLMSRPSFGGTAAGQQASQANEKRGNFLHRLIHKRRSRSDCDLGSETTSEIIGTPTFPHEPSSLRLTMPPRSLSGCGPSSNSSSSSNTGTTGNRNRVRPRPLPSPGVEDLRLFPGHSHLRPLHSGHHTCPHRRPPQRSASGSELTSLPADYHEFYPAPCDHLRHSSTSLSLVSAATSSGTVSAGGNTSGTAASVPVPGAAEVPLSPIREDLRASANAACGSTPAPSSSGYRRTRSTSTSSGVSCGCGCGNSGSSSICGSVIYGHLARLPSTSSGSTAPSPPVQMRRCRLHTQTSTETSQGSPPPPSSERGLTGGTGGESTSAASSPDTQPPFLSGGDQLDLTEPLARLDSNEVNVNSTTSSSAPVTNVNTGPSALPGSMNLRSTGDLPACGSCSASLHHYVNMTPSTSGHTSTVNPSLRDRELSNTGYVNLDLRGEIHFSCPAGGHGYDGVYTLSSTPASSTRASLVLNEDSRSVNFAPLDLRPITKMTLPEAGGTSRPLNYAQLQWMPNHRAVALGGKVTGDSGHHSHPLTSFSWGGSGSGSGAGAGEETEEEGGDGHESTKRDGYIEIDPVKTFAVNKVLANEGAEGATGRQPKRHSSMKNGSTRRVPRFRFSSRKSYESTAPS